MCRAFRAYQLGERYLQLLIGENAFAFGQMIAPALALPWELDLRGVYDDEKFDYLLEARRAFSSPPQGD